MKGVQRRMIVVRTENSPYFEEAHFLLKCDREAPPPDEGDILREANRIVEESLFPYAHFRRKTKKASLLRQILFFAAGLLFGGGLIALILLL